MLYDFEHFTQFMSHNKHGDVIFILFIHYLQ